MMSFVSTDWPDMGKRQQNRTLRDTFGRVGKEWDDEFKMDHFTVAGGRKYRYKKRKGEGLPHSSKAFQLSYTGRKLRLIGHAIPLVFSGVTRALAQISRIAPQKNRVKVITKARGLNRKNPQTDINMVEEFRTIIPREITHLEATAAKFADSRIVFMRHAGLIKA